ncbi:two-component system response regulator TorR [Roseobacter denitrificans]|uniref:Response regulator TorR, putative n=1 Tax=Roseobacter denitrificans (strain ATCC 33942 / OCh 114) TaxID=375451 RepID=Q162F4_ROSDO|nr:response regulator [Roseobacter denitrificans]ABG33139.1 response regulator TorR, putative [Roseobacter denitrificans OCh 114]AVL52502.1 two-component system response regulator TorR [Roseobacter denitrificans]SFG07272.1 two-component system, OmpR family, torCAD operon response regulator TorR [Roseobacter denitrificans OCh 114]
MPQHILIIEDDRTTRTRLAAYLREQGYRVSEAENADTMEQIIAEDPPELLLIDINLEGKDGLTITREQRSVSRVGIILLTARDDQVDKIVGLEMGADDYITKPFDKRELAARVKNLLARIADIGQAPQGAAPVEEFGPWAFDRIRRRLVSAARTETLTKQEFDVMSALADHPGQTLSRARLAEMMGRRALRSNDRMIDVVVGRLRKKLEHDPANPEWILTEHGRGYHFVDPGAI